MERRNLEDSFKAAFERAEKEPNENVWTNIELELEKNAAGKMRRRLVFYQLLAAASVSFALLTVGIGYYAFKTNSTNLHVAQNQNTTQKNTDKTAGLSIDKLKQSDTVVDGDNKAFNNHQTDTRGKNDLATTQDGEKPKSNFNEKDDFISASNDNKIPILPFDNAVTPNTTAVVLDFMKERPLPQLYSVKSVSLNFEKPESTADPVARMFWELEKLEKELAGEESNKKKKANTEKLWTSVGFSAGGYNSGTPTISQGQARGVQNYTNIAYSNAINNQTSASGVSYSFGMSMGTRIAGRWVMQSGINYMNNNSEYVSNQVVYSEDFKNFKAASLSDLRASSNNVLQTAEHKVNSSLEYLSIPVQAGFIAVDRKLGLQLNAGVATDFFIQNTIDPQGSSLDKTQVSRGSESPYRSTNFSGLVSTEFSYRFASRYRVSLNPGIRYPLNSIYKSESGISATPFIFDVGLRFRYIFN